PAVYSFDVVVTDDGTGLLTDTETITVTVNEANVAPVADPVADQFPDEGDTVSLTATATDADTPNNALSWTQDSGPGSVDAAGNYSWITGEADGPGTYTVVLRVTDDGSPTLDDTVSFDVTVAEINTAPVADPIADRFPDEGDTVSLTATASDTDVPANTLTWSQTGGPGSVLPNGDYSWTTTEADGPGTYAVTLEVTDGTDTDTVSFDITVAEINIAPVLDPVGAQAGDEGTLISFTATATDADLPANSLTFTLEDGAGSVPAGAAITATGDFAWTPSEAQGPGVFSFDVVVTDDGSPNLEDRETITVAVAEVDTPPTLNPVGDRITDEGSLLVFTATSSDPDVPANRSYSLADGAGSVPAGAGIDPLLGLFGWTPTEAQGPGSYAFDVVVTDNTGLEDRETITVTVTEVNDAPILAPIGDQTVTELVALSFTAVASDPDLPANTLVFSLSGAPTGATISAGGVFGWIPTEAQGPGSYTFDVIVTDDGTPNQEDRETITVTVAEQNSPPVLAPIGDRVVDEATLLAFVATAVDSDVPVDLLAFSLVGAPAAATIDPVVGAFAWTPAESDGPGAYSFDIVVNDSLGLTDSETITITVAEVNQAPTIVNPGDQEGGEGAETTLALVGGDTDEPANLLTWSATGLPPGLSIDPLTGLISGIVNPGSAADSPFAVTVLLVDDATPSLSETAAFAWAIAENSAPDAGADLYEVGPGGTLVVSAPGVMGNDSDPDGDGLTASLVVGPSAGTLTFDPDGAFTYVHNGGSTVEDAFVYQVDDGRGGLTLATVKISVAEPNLPPILAADFLVILEDGVGSLVPLLNDSDPNGDALTLLEFSQPEFGVLVPAAAGALAYTPPADFFGEVTSTYTVVDGQGGVVSGLISITVEPVNDLPVGGADSATLRAYLPFVLDVLANDLDVEGDRLRVT
ncbi:MAG: tandem-95 repeat protein, partial [Acidimicrobiia bacterium]|nr:tandem-95 repeat protein [Acidimicrobiia bacterium]